MISFETDAAPLIPPTCSEIFVDSGNTNGNYQNNENITTTICSDNTGDVVTVTFTSFSTETNFDKLNIYDGADANATLLGEFDGTDLPPTFTSTATSGCLTFVFTSDISATRDGWEANVTCAPPPTCLAVTNLVEVITDHNSATIQFDENNTPAATAWEVEVVPSGTTPTETGIAITDNPYTITGLQASSVYDVYVRVDCGAGDFSTWSEVLTFDAIDAPVIDYPYDVAQIPFQIYGQPFPDTMNMDDAYICQVVYTIFM